MDWVSQEQLVRICLSLLATVCWVALPLLPALLIHRLLPGNSIEIQGPLNGLTVKAAGGIASYIVLLLVVGGAMQMNLFPIIQSLDDGSWQFQIPIVLRDKDANPMLMDGVQVSAVSTPHQNPDVEEYGMQGYRATLVTSKASDGHLPTITLVAHFPSGLVADSEPIDLDKLASSQKGLRDILVPLKPLRARNLPPSS